MPQMVGSGQQPNIPKTSQRFGCFPARIGAQLEHRLEKDLSLESGRLLKRGGKVHVTVEDLTRVDPDNLRYVEWMCRHPDCMREGKRYKSKAALIQDHASNRELEKAEEAHLFNAVMWVPAQEACAEERDKKTGEIVRPAQEARPMFLKLLSDEE